MGVCGAAAITAVAFLILPRFWQDGGIGSRPIVAGQFLTVPYTVNRR
jgi:hypothetical protein